MSDRISRPDVGDSTGSKEGSQSYSLKLRRLECKQYPSEVKDLIQRARPSLPDEAREILARLEAQKPDKYPPFDRNLLRFPTQTEQMLDKLRVSPATSSSPEIQAAYDQRSADIQRLWQLLQPEFYKELFEKHDGLNIKLTSTLLDAEIERGDATMRVPDKFGTAMYTKTSDRRKYLLVDAKCSPGEAIGYCVDHLSRIDRYAKAIETGKDPDFLHILVTPLQERYQRTISTIELNHMLGKHGTPERYNPLQKKYRQAYEQAIQQAYANKTINSETAEKSLRALGQEAGRKCIREIFETAFDLYDRKMDEMVRRDERLYSTQFPERLFKELRGAEQLGVPRFKLGTLDQYKMTSEYLKASKRIRDAGTVPSDIGNAEMRAMINSWAQQQVREVSPHEHPTVTEQRWHWIVTEKDQLIVSPAYMSAPRPGDKPLIYQVTDVMVAKGKPIKTGGTFTLRVEQPLQPGENMKVSLRDVNNATESYMVFIESMTMHDKTFWHPNAPIQRLKRALNLNGINTNFAELKDVNHREPGALQAKFLLNKVRDSLENNPHSTVRSTERGLVVVERKKQQVSSTSADTKDVLAHIHPSEEWIQVHRVVYERTIPLFAREYGLSIESTQEQLNAKVAMLVRNKLFFKRMKPEDFAQVVRDGRFKTQLETRKSIAKLEPRRLVRVEQHLFGFPIDGDPQKRPIRGYLADNPFGHAIDIRPFGSVAIRFDESMISCMTFTLGDTGFTTRGENMRGYLQCLPIALSEELRAQREEPNIRALPLVSLRGVLPYKVGQRNPLSWGSLSDMGTYAEWHAHGGVQTSRVKEVIYLNPSEIISHPEWLAPVIQQGISCSIDFSRRFIELEESPLEMLGRMRKELKNKYGQTIEFTPLPRVNDLFLTELGLQGRNTSADRAIFRLYGE